MPHQFLFVKFYYSGDNCYQWVPFGFAYLFHIWKLLSLIIIPWGAVKIPLVSRDPQINHNHHLLHQRLFSVKLVYMIFTYNFPMRPAQILLQPQAHHTQRWSFDQCLINYHLFWDPLCCLHTFYAVIFYYTNKMICSKHSCRWTF